MKSTLDIIDILWKLIEDSSLKEEITGNVYKHERPAGSKKEDVVINSLPINNLQLQESLVNVNIYAPNGSVKAGGVQNDTVAHERLQELTAIATGVLDDVFNQVEDTGFDVQQMVLIKDDTTGEFYMNIRITTYNIN